MLIQEFGIDIVGEDNKTIIHHKVAARVVSVLSEQDAYLVARAEQHQHQLQQQQLQHKQPPQHHHIHPAHAGQSQSTSTSISTSASVGGRPPQTNSAVPSFSFAQGGNP